MTKRLLSGSGGFIKVENQMLQANLTEGAIGTALSDFLGVRHTLIALSLNASSARDSCIASFC